MPINVIQMSATVSLLYFDVRGTGSSWLGGCGRRIHDAKVWWARVVGLSQPEDDCLQSPMQAGSKWLAGSSGRSFAKRPVKLSELTQNTEAWKPCGTSGSLACTASPEGLEHIETAKNCVLRASDLSHLEKQRSGIGSSDFVQHEGSSRPTKTLGSLVHFDPCVLCDREASMQRVEVSGGCSRCLLWVVCQEPGAQKKGSAMTAMLVGPPTMS